MIPDTIGWVFDLWNSLMEWILFFRGTTSALILLGSLLMWFILQILPGKWAGGKLFEARIAWVTCTLIFFYVLGLYLIPLMTLELFSILTILVLIAILTYYMRRKSRRTRNEVK